MSTKQRIFGEIGESFAYEYLEKHGYKVFFSDEINNIAHSLLTNSFYVFDVTEDEIKSLCKRCRKKYQCISDRPPCKFYPNIFFKPNIFYKDNLSTIPNSNKFSLHCAHKLTFTCINNDSLISSKQGNFLTRYMQIHHYIFNYYTKNSSKIPIEIESGGKVPKVWHKYWEGHPGRLDFFVEKNNDYSTWDVKVNNSKLSKWQLIRLAWMKQFGYKCGIIRILFNDKEFYKIKKYWQKEDYQSIYNIITPEIRFEEVNINDYPDDYLKEVPSIEVVKKYIKNNDHYINIESK